VATGHYARLVRDPGSGMVQLLRGLDPSKDQSYFLASVRQAMLERFTFPVGGWLRRLMWCMSCIADASIGLRGCGAGAATPCGHDASPLALAGMQWQG
jgi:hypothetical protein